MTEKEKAKELLQKFWYVSTMYKLALGSTPKPHAKACALICVDEILREHSYLHKPEYQHFAVNGGCDGYQRQEYWQGVKTEIEKL